MRMATGSLATESGRIEEENPGGRAQLGAAARATTRLEKMPAHLAWILEEDRRVTIPVPDREGRNFNLVGAAFAE